MMPATSHGHTLTDHRPDPPAFASGLLRYFHELPHCCQELPPSAGRHRHTLFRWCSWFYRSHHPLDVPHIVTDELDLDNGLLYRAEPTFLIVVSGILALIHKSNNGNQYQQYPVRYPHQQTRLNFISDHINSFLSPNYCRNSRRADQRKHEPEQHIGFSLRHFHINSLPE